MALLSNTIGDMKENNWYEQNTMTIKEIINSLNNKLDKSGGVMTGPLTLNDNPIEANHAATKQYVDAVASGLDLKKSVRVATTENITLSGLQTIDSITVVAGDRVLVKNQTNAIENGIYVANSYEWNRSEDFNDIPDTEVMAGVFTFVEEGTVNGDTGWVLVTDNPVIVGTSELTFTQFSGVSNLSIGAGLTKK